MASNDPFDRINDIAQLPDGREPIAPLRTAPVEPVQDDFAAMLQGISAPQMGQDEFEAILNGGSSEYNEEGDIDQPLGGGWLQSFAQGASFGFVDEMSAMVDAAYMSLPDGDQDFWKNYDESWSIRNQQNDAYSAANPATAMTMEIVGAIMSGGASIAAGRGAAKVGVGRLTSKQAAALNAGIEVATGDVVLLLDSDDWAVSTRVERVVHEFAADAAIQAVRHDMRAADAGGHPLSDRHYGFVIASNPAGDILRFGRTLGSTGAWHSAGPS